MRIGLQYAYFSFGVGWGGGNNVHANLNAHGLYGVHRATICISVIWGGVGVGWGGGNNVHVNLNRHGLYGVQKATICISVIWGGVGVGWGGGNNVHGNLNIRPATLWNFLLHLRTYVLLRCGIFSCAHTSCYALGSSDRDCFLHLLCVWSSLTSISIF